MWQFEGEEMDAAVEAESRTGASDDCDLAGKVEIFWKFRGLYAELRLEKHAGRTAHIGLHLE